MTTPTRTMHQTTDTKDGAKAPSPGKLQGCVRIKGLMAVVVLLWLGINLIAPTGETSRGATPIPTMAPTTFSPANTRPPVVTPRASPLPNVKP